MRVLITGASGMIGRKLTARLIADGVLAGRSITALDLADLEITSPAEAKGIAVTAHRGDLAAPGVAEGLAASRPDVIFHLAGVVSGEAEADFEKGMRVNLGATQCLFEAVRRVAYAPRLVYASSIAVFGAPFPDVITDDFTPAPLTSYGAQKLMGEILLNDYSRRGFFDGIGLRLPTIAVRPGAPNRAASGFFSGIIREPLAGKEAILPVPRDVVHTHASPRSAVGFLVHAAGLDAAALGSQRCLTLPGVAVSVGGQIEALRRIAGDQAAALIRDEPDAAIWAIVKNWPQRYDAARARALGFVCETSFDDIIKAHIED